MSLVIMILLISMLIIVHEIGHFIAAKAFGIAVPKFGFGLPIGPTLYKKQVGDTEILVHAFLLGGYVSFLDDEEHPEVSKESPLRFQNKPIWQRAVVVSAGVISNVLTAVLIVMLVAAFVHHLPSRESNVYIHKIIAEKNAPVHSIGLQKGDMLYDLNGTRVTSVSYLAIFSAGSKKFNGLVTEQRLEDKIEELKKLNPNLNEKSQIEANTTILLPEFDDEAAVTFSQSYLIGLSRKNRKMSTVKLNDAQKALRDKIYNKKSFATEEALTLKDVALAISDTVAPLNITVKRDNQLITLKPLYVDETGIIGVEESYEPIMRKTTNIKSVFVESIKYLFNQTYLMILSLVMLFAGQVPFKELHGIILITKIGSDIISSSGIINGLMLTSMISLNLAIMNLLPIPALDGGHLLFLLVEKIKGKPMDEKVLEKISSFCFILLLVLMCLVLFNDVYALITKKYG